MGKCPAVAWRGGGGGGGAGGGGGGGGGVLGRWVQVELTNALD